MAQNRAHTSSRCGAGAALGLGEQSCRVSWADSTVQPRCATKRPDIYAAKSDVAVKVESIIRFHSFFLLCAPLTLHRAFRGRWMRGGCIEQSPHLTGSGCGDFHPNSPFFRLHAGLISVTGLTDSQQVLAETTKQSPAEQTALLSKLNQDISIRTSCIWG